MQKNSDQEIRIRREKSAKTLLYSPQDNLQENLDFFWPCLTQCLAYLCTTAQGIGSRRRNFTRVLASQWELFWTFFDNNHIHYIVHYVVLFYAERRAAERSSALRLHKTSHDAWLTRTLAHTHVCCMSVCCVFAARTPTKANPRACGATLNHREWRRARPFSGRMHGALAKLTATAVAAAGKEVNSLPP